MNMAVKALQQTTFFPTWIISWSIPTKQQLIVFVLLMFLSVSAFGLIYVRDVNRRLMGQLQVLQVTYQNLSTSRSQLLLEKSTLSSEARIQRLAKQQLHMVQPSAKSIVMV